MIAEVTKVQEASVSLLTGAAGTVVASWLYWEIAEAPVCEAVWQGATTSCVTTATGVSRSWVELATKPEAVVLALALAGVVYLVFEVLVSLARRFGDPQE